MRTFKRIALVVIILILAFIAYTLISTGYFRRVENKFNGQIFQKIAIPGAEDITISHLDSFAIVSSTVRGIYPPTQQEKGNLFFLDLKNNQNYGPINLTANFKKHFAPHGISILKTNSSYTIMAINHTQKGHFIEVFSLDGEQLVHQKTLRHQSMVSPNDLVMIDNNRFYFTNDHRYTNGLNKIIEEYLGLSLSNVIYFDGKNYHEVADGIAYANGINFDTKRNLLYVASPRKFRIKVYNVQNDGNLEFVENIPCKTGVDNIEIDMKGNLWIGAHPNLLRFGAYAKGKKQFAPSEIIKINYNSQGKYTVEQIYTNDGIDMSGSSVATPFGNLIFMGNVKDNHFLILKSLNN